MNWNLRSANCRTISVKYSLLTNSMGAASKSCRQSRVSTSTRCSRASVTRCFICASACRAFTTSLLTSEETQHEKENDLDGASGDSGGGDFHHHWWRSGDAFVELESAGVVRMAANYLLAGSRTVRSLPDSVRRPGYACAWLPSLQFSMANGR